MAGMAGMPPMSGHDMTGMTDTHDMAGHDMAGMDMMSGMSMGTMFTYFNIQETGWSVLFKGARLRNGGESIPHFVFLTSQAMPLRDARERSVHSASLAHMSLRLAPQRTSPAPSSSRSSSLRSPPGSALSASPLKPPGARRATRRLGSSAGHSGEASLAT